MTPYGAQANNGNWRTASRWSRMLRDAFRVIVQVQSTGAGLPAADCLIALHARRSHASIAAWRAQFPRCPLVVVLTGTDLYRDLPGDPDASASLQLADRLVVLQEHGIEDLPREHRSKARVIYQSAPRLTPTDKPRRRLNCLFVGHLREEKDPLTAVRAWGWVPAQAPVRLALVGGAVDASLAARVREAERVDDRVHWLGARIHGWTRQAIKRAHLLIVASRMEGGANTIVEAVTAGTPVLASRVPGNVGMLGPGYDGYFQVGQPEELARLVTRCYGEPGLITRLAQQCRARAPLFTPARERSALHALLRELV